MSKLYAFILTEDHVGELVDKLGAALAKVL